jgi:hypothetical protein
MCARAGELALLIDEPQEKTIKSLGDSAVLKIDRRTFKRLIGGQKLSSSQAMKDALIGNRSPRSADKLRSMSDDTFHDSEEEDEDSWCVLLSALCSVLLCSALFCSALCSLALLGSALVWSPPNNRGPTNLLS